MGVIPGCTCVLENTVSSFPVGLEFATHLHITAGEKTSVNEVLVVSSDMKCRRLDGTLLLRFSRQFMPSLVMRSRAIFHLVLYCAIPVPSARSLRCLGSSGGNLGTGAEYFS